MEERSKIHVGLDVHKDSISVAAAEPGRTPGRLIGKVTHDLNKLLKVLAKVGPAEQLHIVYEAGPTGFGMQRALTGKGYTCEIIAPSQIPRRPGERIKTDTRDSVQLAECSRAGQLSAVWIPDPADEAIRDLSRAREDAVHSRVQARHQLKGFLLRHDVRYTGKTSWCGAYYRWLGTLNFGAGSAITAIGLVAEIGDLGRFAHPRKLMGYLGLVPSEHSSGERTSRGSITKTGNAHARRLLTEAAWNYRFKARICKQAQIRQQELSEPIRRMAWTAQLRLTQRFAALNARGLQANKACVAVARELAGFVWAIGMQVHREKVQAT